MISHGTRVNAPNGLNLKIIHAYNVEPLQKYLQETEQHCCFQKSIFYKQDHYFSYVLIKNNKYLHVAIKEAAPGCFPQLVIFFGVYYFY